MAGGEGWSQRLGLNQRPALYESAALPLSYVGTDGRKDGNDQ